MQKMTHCANDYFVKKMDFRYTPNNSFQRIIDLSHLIIEQFTPNSNQSEAMICPAGLERY